jgi:hypothetical protein
MVDRMRVVAFDHGDAFAFLLPLLGQADPATAPLLDEVVRGHVFGRSFGRRQVLSLARMREAIRALNDRFFDALRAATPAGWTAGAAGGMIERTISVLRQRRDAVDLWLPQVEAWIRK